jgi:hypothetical protein
MDAIQTYFRTAFLRNHSVFQAANRRLLQKKPHKDLRLLSFGCSVGDEIATMRTFFPEAEIFACDVQESLLDIARASFQDDRIHVFRSTPENIRSNGPYDLIIASAVLCVNPSPPDYARAFPFARYDGIVAMFDECLADDGILAMPNAGYLFLESSVYDRYRPVRSDIMHGTTFVDVFRNDGTIFLKQQPSYGRGIYSRHGEPIGADDEEVFDCLFEKTSGPREPVFEVFAPVPPDLGDAPRFTRRNIDYSPVAVPENVVVFEEKIAMHPSGFSTQIGWSSFTGPGMYYRPARTWTPTKRGPA